MDVPSIDDRLKEAQANKTNAEAQKIAKEAELLRDGSWAGFWSEAVKVLGGVVLGMGGVIVAYTQYEVSELKAKIAKEDLSRSQAAKSEAEKLRESAELAAHAALAKRDVALRELREAELTTADYKASLTKASSELKAATPNHPQKKLVYIQFRGDLSRDLIAELRASLTSKGFNAPGAERVGGDYQNIVKYFRSTEDAQAAALAKHVEAFFAAQGCPLQMRIVPSAITSTQNPPQEIWLAHQCQK